MGPLLAPNFETRKPRVLLCGIVLRIPETRVVLCVIWGGGSGRGRRSKVEPWAHSPTQDHVRALCDSVRLPSGFRPPSTSTSTSTPASFLPPLSSRQRLHITPPLLGAMVRSRGGWIGRKRTGDPDRGRPARYVRNELFRARSFEFLSKFLL